MVELLAFLDGRSVGRFVQSRGGTITFHYDEEPQVETPISLSMPTGLRDHRQRAARPYLAGLLPDNTGALEAIARRFHTSSGSLFGMLAGIGRDVPGALQLLEPGSSPEDGRAQAPRGEEVDDVAIAELLTAAIEVYRDGRSAHEDEFRFSVPGAQAKVALTQTMDGRWLNPDADTATTHILKPASADQPLPDMDAAESITLEAARRVGLRVASTEVWHAPDGNLAALVVERYDRQHDAAGGIRRIHQEDLTQALSVPPEKKYQEQGGPGVGKIAELIRQRIGASDQRAVARAFFEGFVFNIVTLGTDAHAKNYSLLLDGERVSLAPLYDLLSAALSYDSDADGRRLRPSMWVGGERSFDRVSPDDLAREGVRLGLARRDAEEVVTSLIATVPEALVSAAQDAGRPDMAAAAERNLARHSPARLVA